MHPDASSSSLDVLSGWTIAVTGAGGYLGASLVDALLRVGARPWRVTRAAGTLAPRPDCEDMVSHPAELATWERIAQRADAVVHLGAVTSATAAEAEPEASERAGPLPMQLLTQVLARGAGACRLRAVVTAGSASQYGSGAVHDESAPDRPPGVYEEHKCKAERALGPLRSLGVRLSFARLANVYGPGKSPAAPDRGVLTRMAERALGGAPIPVWKPGDWLRDYVHIDDVSSALATLVAHGGLERDGRYLVCSGRSVPLRRAAELVSDAVLMESGVRVPVEMVQAPRPMLPVEMRQFEGVPSRLQRLGWKPNLPLDAGLAQTVRAFARSGIGAGR